MTATRTPMRSRRTQSWVALATLAAFAPLVAACSDDADSNGEASAEFTGDDCIYSGPTDFEVGDDFEVTVSDVTEERVDAGFAVNKVKDGTTVAEVREQGIEPLADGPETFLMSEVTEAGTERMMSITLDVPGTWAVVCFFFNPDGQFAATTLEVVEPS